MTASTMERKKPRNNIIKYIAVAIVWLLIWELASAVINEEILFVAPHAVLRRLLSMFRTTEYWQTILFSVFRVLGGFIIGYAQASLLALIAHRFEFFRAFAAPAVSVIKSTPVASFIILALMWTGKDFVPVLICILMVTPIVWSNVLEGLENVDNDLLEAAQVYKLSYGAKLRYIYLPSLVPYSAAAAGSGLGLCWKAGIAAEVICRTMPSIGNSIWETKFYIETDEMFAWTLTVVLLSVVFDFVLKRLSGAVLKKTDAVRNMSDDSDESTADSAATIAAVNAADKEEKYD